MPLVRETLVRYSEGGDEAVFVDDAATQGRVNGHRVLTFDGFLREQSGHRAICIAIADPRVRERIAGRCTQAGLSIFSVRAREVVVMDDVEIGEGAILSPFVTLTSNIRIGRHFHGNLYSCVEHDCVVGDFVTFAPGVRCNGNIVIEDRAYVGAGAVLRQGRPGAPLVIGRDAVVGMGAVVTRDVAPGTTVVGNPARRLGSS
jgi:sugar O-acyltransferase (sialic acid O-acetyltransferase NeuD family)